MSGPSIDQRRSIWGSSIGLVLGGLPFMLTLLDYRFDLQRTAVKQGFASNFFDIQARAFLDGRISVPENSLGIEGFVVDGNTYMYFPPFPALLRIPVMWVTNEFDGKLSLVSMGIAWVVFAVLTVKLYWLVRSCIRPGVAVSRLDAVCAAIFIAAATGGTVLTFVASLPWVYHEVYMWAVALVVGTMYWLVRVSLKPTPQAIAWLGAFTLATILTRTTGGIAMCLAVGAAGAWLYFRRPEVDQRLAKWVMACAAVPLVVSIAYNTAKFGQPFLFPLESQVWTEVNSHRREVLEANNGSLTGAQFFLTSFANYLGPTGIRFVDYFPWITLPAEPAQAYGGAIVDQTYRTGSIAAFMPLLLLLSIGSLAVIFRRRQSTEIAALRAPLIGGVLVTGGIMAYGYVANRYTSEFVPVLVMGGAVGMNAVAAQLQRRPRNLKLAAVSIMAILAAFSIGAQMATAVAITAQTTRGKELIDYIALQYKLSGGPGSPVSRLVTTSDDAPSGGRTDQLHIQGDCDALYLNTGDQYEPWILVAARDSVVEVRAGEVVRDAVLPLFELTSSRKNTIGIETDSTNRARVVTRAEGEKATYGYWFGLQPGDAFTVGLRTLTDYGLVEVSSLPGGFASFVPSVTIDDDWFTTPGSIEAITPDARALRRSGLAVNSLPGFPVQLCEQLAADASPGRS